MVFQDPVASLNPLIPIGNQTHRSARQAQGHEFETSRGACYRAARVGGIPSPKQRMHQYPFEFSGGMSQRMMIALALAPEPDLIIADEPTTALDVTIRRRFWN